MSAPAAAAVPVRRVRAGDVDLAVREWGAGPPLVLLHGGPGGSGQYWPRSVPWLRARFRLVAPDLRGHGHSERRAPYSIATFARDTSALFDALGLDRVTLLGHSYGALVATETAIADPRVDRLVLVGGFPRTWRMLLSPRGMPTKLALGARLAGWNAANAMGRAPPMKPFLRALLRRAEPVFLGPDSPPWVDDVLFESVVDPLDAVVPLQWDLLRWNAWDRLPRIRARTLVVVGGADDVGLPDAEQTVRRIPDARLVVIPGCGHSPFLEKPEEFHRVLDAFLDGP